MPMSTSLDVRVERLRAQLDADEQALLTLRIDKRMDWKDIAFVMLFDEGALPAEDEAVREAARLRKRFQLVKGSYASSLTQAELQNWPRNTKARERRTLAVNDVQVDPK